MHAAFCVGRARRLDDWLPDTGDTDARAHVMWMIDRCPSGSYTYALEPDDMTPSSRICPRPSQ